MDATTDDVPEEAPVPPPEADGTAGPDADGRTASQEAPATTPEPGGLSEERRLRTELWDIARAAIAANPLPSGWHVDEVGERVVCPNGERLFPYAVESEVRRKGGRERTKHGIMLRTEMRACNGCPHREGCTSSDRTAASKQVMRSIVPEAARRGREILALLRPHAHADAVRRRRAQKARAAPRQAPPPPRPERTELPSTPPGPLKPTSPLFLPARSRQRARAALSGLEMDVLASVPARRSERRGHPLLARDVPDRQHRRHDLARRSERWRLHRTATLLIGGNPEALLPGEKTDKKRRSKGWKEGMRIKW